MVSQHLNRFLYNDKSPLYTRKPLPCRVFISGITGVTGVTGVHPPHWCLVSGVWCNTQARLETRDPASSPALHNGLAGLDWTWWMVVVAANIRHFSSLLPLSQYSPLGLDIFNRRTSVRKYQNLPDLQMRGRDKRWEIEGIHPKCQVAFVEIYTHATLYCIVYTNHHTHKLISSQQS